MSNEKSGSRTLLMSVLMSAPGPLIVGLGLLSGRSSTQIADFFRRSAELLAIIMAYAIYKITTKDEGLAAGRREKLERVSNRFVGSAMVIGGIIMIAIALLSEVEDKGNVVPGLVIAVLGVIANTIFWHRYSRLNREKPNAIIAVQARLYRAKSLVDGCVVIALSSVLLAPQSRVSLYLDFIGTVVVAIYLAWCGARTLMLK